MVDPARVLTIYSPKRLATSSRSTAIHEGMTFHEAVPLWLQSRRAFISQATCGDYEAYISRLEDFFGGIVLENISGDHIREYQQLRGRTCGASVINHEVGIVVQILKRLGRWPVPGGYQPLPLPKESSGRCIEDWERERYFRMAASNPAWEVAYCAARIMDKSGICPGELRQVRLKDIRQESHDVRILFGKNLYRERWVPLTQDAWAAMEQLLKRADKLGSRDPEHYLMPFRRGTGRYDPMRPTKGWRTSHEAICAASGIEVRQYWWRHTAATRLLENPNNSTETVVAVLGHVSPRMVRRVYNHARMEVMRRAVEGLDTDPETKRPEKS